MDKAKLALILLELRGKELLIFQRRDADAPTSPSLLGLFGGHMEPDEKDPLEAAYRELDEETSLGLGTVLLTHVMSLWTYLLLIGA